MLSFQSQHMVEWHNATQYISKQHSTYLIYENSLDDRFYIHIVWNKKNEAFFFSMKQCAILSIIAFRQDCVFRGLPLSYITAHKDSCVTLTQDIRTALGREEADKMNNKRIYYCLPHMQKRRFQVCVYSNNIYYKTKGLCTHL